jgi:hypothetical protein
MFYLLHVGLSRLVDCQQPIVTLSRVYILYLVLAGHVSGLHLRSHKSLSSSETDVTEQKWLLTSCELFQGRELYVTKIFGMNDAHCSAAASVFYDH